MEDSGILRLWTHLLLLLVIVFTGQAFSKPVQLDETNQLPISLEAHYQLFVDNSDDVTIDDILAPDSQILFF